MSKLWLTVLSRLREDEVCGVQPVPQAAIESSSCVASTSNRFTEGQRNLICSLDDIGDCTKSLSNSKTGAASMRSENQVLKTLKSGCGPSQNVLRMPPLQYLEKFEDCI